MAYTFFLQGKRTGATTILGGRYGFSKGYMTVNDSEGKAIRNILEDFYNVVTVVHLDNEKPKIPEQLRHAYRKMKAGGISGTGVSKKQAVKDESESESEEEQPENEG